MCSYKGGDPGFVRVLDASWLAFPNYDGNGKYQSMGNLRKNPHVGMLFVDFIQGRRLRLQGSATVEEEDTLLVTYPGAQFIVRVQVTEVYNNCPRYIHKYQLVERSAYVPRGDRETPVPDWKRRDDMQALLPAHDPVRKLFNSTPESGGSSSMTCACRASRGYGVPASPGWRTEQALRTTCTPAVKHPEGKE